MGAPISVETEQPGILVELAKTRFFGGLVLLLVSTFPGGLYMTIHLLVTVGISGLFHFLTADSAVLLSTTAFARMGAITFLVSAAWCVVLWFRFRVKIRFFWLPAPISYALAAGLLWAVPLLEHSKLFARLRT